MCVFAAAHQLLKAHARHHHADRHLATHIAHVWREEEGYVLINAHPAFEELLSLTGIINEPPAKVRHSRVTVPRSPCRRPLCKPELRPKPPG